MKTDAELKARRRAGYKSYLLEVREQTFKNTLVAQGLLADRDLEDDNAIRAAGSKYIERSYGVHIPVIRPAPPLPPPEKPKTYKPKAQVRSRHGPCRTLSQEERARWAAQDAARRTREEANEELWEELERDQERRRIELEAEDLRQHQFRRIRLDEEKQKHDEDMRRRIANAPVSAEKKRAWDNLGKSGIRKKGGKPVPNGFAPYPFPKSQADTVKPIKQLAPAQLAAREKRFGKLENKDRPASSTFGLYGTHRS